MAIGCLTACVTVHTQNINHWKYVKDFNIISDTAFSVFFFLQCNYMQKMLWMEVTPLNLILSFTALWNCFACC